MTITETGRRGWKAIQNWISLIIFLIYEIDCELRRADFFKMPKLTPEETKAEEARMLEEVVDQEQMCEEAPLVFTWLLTAASILLVIITAPFSLLCTLKVVQEITFVSTLQTSFVLLYSGIWKGCHLPAGSDPRRRGERPRHLLHSALHWQVWDRGHAGPELVSPAPGDDHQVSV